MTAASKSSSLGQMHAMMDMGAAATIACTQLAAAAATVAGVTSATAFAHKLLDAAASRAQTAYAAAEVTLAEAQAAQAAQMLVQNPDGAPTLATVSEAKSPV